jgi:SEC-C motif
LEQMNKALALSQVCWNMSLLPEDQHDQMLDEMRTSLQMDEDEFDDFRRSIIDPMLRRHHEMFPLMHRRGSTAASPSGHLPQVQSIAAAREPYPGTGASPSGPTLRAQSRTLARGEPYPGTGPYALCPCNSGKKYKFCCRTKGR